MSKISKGDIESVIKKLEHEYTGTGASGGNATDGNDITSPRPFADDMEEMENYIFKNIYGGEGGQYRGMDSAFGPSYNRHPQGLYEEEKELRSFIQKEIRKYYGVHDTYGVSSGQRRNLSGLPGVMEDEDLKEFTDYGQEGRYPKKEKPGDMFQQKEVEDMFPNGMASRSDKAFQARVKQHADWTEQRAFNTTFVHMQYHETKGLEDDYFIYQTQHYNGNYDDFRNPKFTLLSITKNKDTEKEEDLGEYIVDTEAYVKDLEALRSKGVLGKRVMELFGMKSKPKKTGDAVTVAELELTNDIGKDDYVDDEGRMAKSQLYKMAKYAVKLHGMLDDMEQLPAWVQAKFTKASDYLSSIYHYLDYEFARRDSDLMREMEKYKEAMLEEPNEISYDDAKKKGLKSPDKADISKDKDISDYELKRGMAIQKAIEKQK